MIFDGSTLQELSTDNDNVIRIENSVDFQINDSTFEDIDANVIFHVTGSEGSLTGSTFTSDQSAEIRAIHFQTSNVTVTDTEFDGFKQTDLAAAVYSQNSNTNFNDCRFFNNIAD